MKILSPVSNIENLKTAIYNGADEVYLGINNFNARNNTNCFDLDSLPEAVDFAHLFDVKVNLAINILFTNDELQQATDTIIKAYNIGVDAFIVQDLGLASIIHTNYPEIVLHASTQMGIHNLEGVRFLEKLGFSRVVLSRETPLSEIKRIKENSNIEIEYFAHGALCVSFSGNCYLSSYLCDASGNRGKCKQLCRLPYSLYNNNKFIKKGYLLSAKDFNMLERLNELKEAGVDILKIEGRARRDFYIGTATKAYKLTLNNKSFNNDDLLLGFNRNFTDGYFSGNGNIISNYNNHIGIEIGKITKVNYGKKFNEVFFTSNRTLCEKSTFKTFNGINEESTFTAYDLKKISRNLYMATTTQKIAANNTINLIIDAQKENATCTQKKKRSLDIELNLEINKPIKATISINSKKYDIFGDILQKAEKQPLTQEVILNNLSKSDIYLPKIKFCTLNSVFLPNKSLNEFRRKIYEYATNIITTQYKRNIQITKLNTPAKINKFDNYSFVYTINENFIGKNIIYSPEEYNENDILSFIEKCKSLNKTPDLDIPNFALENDIIILNKIINKTKIGIIANNYYALVFDTDIVIGPMLNVYNNFTANYYNKPVMLAENTAETSIVPVMTLRHCPLKSHTNGNCSKCIYNNNFYYKMENGTKLYLKRKKLSSCTFYLYLK